MRKQEKETIKYHQYWWAHFPPEGWRTDRSKPSKSCDIKEQKAALLLFKALTARKEGEVGIATKKWENINKENVCNAKYMLHALIANIDEDAAVEIVSYLIELMPKTISEACDDLV